MMSTTQTLSVNVDELERLIRRVEPAAFLVPPRLLRRVIKQHCELGSLALLVPHAKGYVINREALLECVRPAELGLTSEADVPPFAFLMIRPAPERLAKHAPGDTLISWRILFHLRIDHEMQQKLSSGSFTTAIARQRIRQLGLAEFAEITDVLRQEKYLLPPESSATVYAEFVAVYLTLRRFDPDRVAHFFPALRDLAEVDALVGEDINADAIFQATRLPEAGERGYCGAGASGSAHASLSRNGTLANGESALACFIDRFKRALELSDADAESWRHALRPIPESAEPWSPEGRLRADLRGVCDASEHGVYTVDLVGWALSLGELPVKRPLPGHQEVAMIRQLRSALNRAPAVRVAADERQRLMHVLIETLECRVRLMRERFRPILAAALDDVGLKPPNVAVEVGRAKLIEELLDRVEAFGHFNIGNLRDAISRNQMKLPDLTGPTELATGDPLIRLNRILAIKLDGVYRRGEIYMRLFHRVSSVAFGTTVGRWLVLFLILPFGLAIFTMITPGIAVEEGEKLMQLIGLLERPAIPHDHPRGAKHAIPIPNLWGVFGLGVFYLLLLHVASFRSRFFYGMGQVGRGLHAVFAYGVLGLIYSPTLQAFLRNRIWRSFRRYVLWPGVMATNGGLIAWLNNLETPAIAITAAVCFALGVVLLNTRLGRDVEEAATDWALRYWAWLSIDLAPGLLHLVMDASRWCLEGVEQGFYRVSEWLRFRSGEGRAVIVAKAIMGLFWFGVTYLLRFAINLLIEPQINPIKHFPVVTVAHKVCLPLTGTLHDFLVVRFGLDKAEAWTFAGGIITSIPGIFGFMVWELKENWKLYASNRAFVLQPMLIGSHGETMLRLLRPGFHSGTIPKLFSRLRRAERRGQENAARKVLAALHHLKESVGHFIERELLGLLRRSPSWSGLPIELGSVRLATGRIAIELSCKTLGEHSLVLALDQQGGWLLAGVLAPGWLPRLNADQRRTLAAAFAGVYKMAGVDLTREQIAASLPGTIFAFDLTDEGLVVLTSADGNQDVVYDLNAGPEIPPEPRPGNMPELNANRLLYRHVPVAWAEWVRSCDGEQVANMTERAYLLLPDCRESPSIDDRPGGPE